jgi:hypothetical protein
VKKSGDVEDRSWRKKVLKRVNYKRGDDGNKKNNNNNMEKRTIKRRRQ